MAVQNNHNGDEKTLREGMVSYGFVRFVKGMGLRKFGLVVLQFQLLHTIEHAELMLILFGEFSGFDISICLILPPRWQVILIFQIWEPALFANPPGRESVMCDEYHVVGINCTERGQPITHDGE
jgi:hypothetical protein